MTNGAQPQASTTPKMDKYKAFYEAISDVVLTLLTRGYQGDNWFAQARADIGKAYAAYTGATDASAAEGLIRGYLIELKRRVKGLKLDTADGRPTARNMRYLGDIAERIALAVPGDDYVKAMWAEKGRPLGDAPLTQRERSTSLDQLVESFAGYEDPDDVPL